ncbi:hypothetical protein CPB83DRAFT_888173 [Crepidotus variabilis]|uniref:Transmembrane protein n=1 Tax=Crepidotus variabilis TaxID=179855 RepID=A0A9P6EUA2_9AGAR|nr:hypothetical protein CPB83DRAFT_888173 [Crepidotus variabilis]
MPEPALDRPTSARWVVIDDTDPRISYTESVWSAQKLVINEDQGTSGRAYNDTLHVLTPLEGVSNRGTAGVSFNFSGVAVEVYITNNLPNITGANAVDCWIDGVQIQINIQPNPSGNPINNYMLCDASNLVDRLHEVLVVPNGSLDSFFFDRIQYRPSANASLENQVLYVDSFDPSMVFGDGWKGTDGAWYSYTSTRGSTFEFEFTGISMAWYGVITAQDSGSPSNFTYTIDGGSPQLVNLTGHPVGSPTLQNQKLFEIPSLSMGKHNLSVVYNGDNTTTALTLDYIYIQNGTFPDASPTSPPLTNQTNQGTKNKSKHVGPIVGCVIAAVLCIIFLALSYLYYRRRRRISKGQIDNPDRYSTIHIEPFPIQTIDQPFVTEGPHLAKGGNVDSDDPETPLRSPRSPTLVKITGVKSGNPSSVALPLASVPLTQTSLPEVDTNYAIEAVPPSGVIRHQDSGVRMREERASGMVELPPEYTPA